jgi:hypothetical protein
MANGLRIAEFDVWREGYAGATVRVLLGGGDDLAPIYSDPGCTVPADNPQTLSSQTISGRLFGKWQQPLYTLVPYYLSISGLNETGVERVPIYGLDGQPAEAATIVVTGGTNRRALAAALAIDIDAENFGAIDATGQTSSATQNTTSIADAIGAAAAQGGGRVHLPAGSIVITTLTIPTNVRLVGHGDGVTVLESQQQQAIVTLTGNGAGFEDLTLDGVDLQANSVGVAIFDLQGTFIRNATVKRFQTGIKVNGSQFSDWRGLTVSNCTDGAKLHGDTTLDGGAWRENVWRGGRVELCTSTGLDIAYVDSATRHNVFQDIAFASNTGTAVKIRGARHTRLDDCEFEGNTVNLDVADATPTVDANTVIGLRLAGGKIDGGAIKIAGTAQDIIFDLVDLTAIAWTLTTPSNAITLRDCLEGTGASISGDGTKLIRAFTTYRGSVVGVTVGSVATKAWSVALRPGEMAQLIARVTGNQRNGTQRAGYVVTGVVHRAPSTLAYQNQTANFTLGSLVTGQTSGATAIICGDSDSGLTGTLSLRTIVGTFQNGETITDSAGGTAKVNGTISDGNCVIDNQAKLQTFEDDSGWDAAFAVNLATIELQVTGANSKTIDWQVDVDMVRNG